MNEICIICGEVFSAGKLDSRYGFCLACKKELVNIKRNVFGVISSSLRYNTNSYIWKFLPYTVQELKYHLQSLFEPWMTWENRGFYIIDKWKDHDISTWTWQIDHIIPQNVFWFLSVRDELFSKCWSLDNLRPISAKMNCLKNGKIK